IQPPDEERARLGPGRWIASVKVCVDETGAVASLSLMKRTGLPGWERRLCEEMRRWRYIPFQAHGRPSTACTAVLFVYQLRAPRRTADASSEDEARRDLR